MKVLNQYSPSKVNNIYFADLLGFPV